MSPEEVARYDNYWNKVEEEKMVPVANKKAMEIYNTQGKKAAGSCSSTIYDPLIELSDKDLSPYYHGQNYKSKSKTAFTVLW